MPTDDERDEPASDDASLGGSDDSLLRAIARSPAARPPDDLSGKRLGRYLVGARLGSGGMGTVYAARDEELRREVALKVLHPRITASVDERKRVLREGRSAAAVGGPHVVAVYEVAEVDGHVFLAMERVHGGSLRTLLARGQGLPVARVIELAKAITAGLSRAHAAGVVHRDLKPDNVLLDADRAIRLCDFGLAKVQSPALGGSGASGGPESAAPLTREGQIVGTPGYMAPEQARGETVGAPADVFALGVLLYEMLVGARPFEAAAPFDVLVAVARDEAPLPSVRRADVPPWLDDLCVRCLAKEASARPTIADVARALETTATDPSPPRAPIAHEAPSRRGARIVLISGVLVLLTTASGWAAHRYALASSTPPSPLASPRSRLACPALAVRGRDTTDGWIGAAIGAMVCRRAVPLLGGSVERALPPAALLDVPARPLDSGDADPLGGRDVRARTLAAAKMRASAFVDGHVDVSVDEVAVELVLRDRNGREAARGRGEDHLPWRAVRQATRALVTEAGIPPRTALDADVARWNGGIDVATSLAMVDFESVAAASDHFAGELGRLRAHRAKLGRMWGAYSRLGADAPPPSIERGTPQRLAWTSYAVAASTVETDFAALARELSRHRAQERSREGRRALLAAEALVRLRADDRSGAEALLLAQTASAPATADWSALAYLQRARTGESGTHRAAEAWQPDRALTHAYSSDTYARDTARWLTLARRGYAVAPDVPGTGILIVLRLLYASRTDEARSIAAQLVASRDTQQTGQLAFARIEQVEGRFGAALERYRPIMLEASQLDHIEHSFGWFHLAQVAGRTRELADSAVDRYLAPGRARVAHEPGSLFTLAALAIFASPDRAARAADVMRDLHAAIRVPDGLTAFITGAESYARGNIAAAAQEWRPIAERGTFFPWVVADAMERAGDVDLARRIDEATLNRSWGKSFRGLSATQPSAALRAERRGDRETARRLASEVITAWGNADVACPAVADMTALLARTSR